MKFGLLFLIGLAVLIIFGCSRSTPMDRCAEKGGVLVGARFPYEICIKREALIDLE